MVEYATYPSLRDKVVLITGASEGIGAAAVSLFCRQGSKVTFLDFCEPSATALISRIQEEIPDAPHRPTFMHCDVTDLPRLKECAESVLAMHGTVDVLINNAGAVVAGSRGPTAHITPDSFDYDIAVNLRHQVFLTQYVVPAMQAQKSGSIINLGSTTWRIPNVRVPVYTTAKAATLGLTRTHSREFGTDGIRVNSVLPGVVGTKRQVDEIITEEFRRNTLQAQSLKRLIVPDEVASLILFLAADDSSAITGSNYVIDGGWVGDP
ncbi:3-oxoacyl-reductase [Pseudomassariella vexata]|uniref:3-oxoacyl-reductase n=1 Tax=Pseudomassariella vexata TaxID=1141098 RepID=A0A1Y2DNZ3_9PEZI|nr:3-oxoacyl-reductase [Pseudomassariella vexata]ORY60992.1 3-oxoacyl-reductase [Pseudomassariella vexata]